MCEQRLEKAPVLFLNTFSGSVLDETVESEVPCEGRKIIPKLVFMSLLESANMLSERDNYLKTIFTLNRLPSSKLPATGQTN
jgi:hypothetical protein